MTTASNDQSPGNFDEAGVANYIKDKAVLNWFRKIVQRYQVPFEHQAKLALILLDEAVEHNKGRLTLPFLRNRRYEDYIQSFLEYEVTEVGEEIGEKIRLKAIEQQLQRELENFMRGLGIIIRSGHTVDGLHRQYPQVPFEVDNGKRRAIQIAKRIIDDLAEKLKPSSRWGFKP
jgi:hypothetical protein